MTNTSPFTPFSGAFPPEGPVTLRKVIPSYLYQEYNDDDDLLAFITSQNELTQEYVDWFVNTWLPVYTSDSISGPLLDWVGTGLYGYPRPSLPSGFVTYTGPYNTFGFNQIAFNSFKKVFKGNFLITTDDVYKRCLTWNTYVGDGKYFTIRWLKRRIMRFLVGVNGTAPNIDQTYQISVKILHNNVYINIINGLRLVTGGAMYNRMRFNNTRFNQIKTSLVQFGTPFPLAPALKEGIETGALALPFQFNYSVTIQS